MRIATPWIQLSHLLLFFFFSQLLTRMHSLCNCVHRTVTPGLWRYKYRHTSSKCTRTLKVNIPCWLTQNHLRWVLRATGDQAASATWKRFGPKLSGRLFSPTPDRHCKGSLSYHLFLCSARWIPCQRALPAWASSLTFASQSPICPLSSLLVHPTALLPVS